jgi:hypothetical protein
VVKRRIEALVVFRWTATRNRLHLRWHLIKPNSDERSPSLAVRSVVAMQVGLSSRWSMPSSIGRYSAL